MQKQSGRNRSQLRKLIYASCLLSFAIVACTGSKGPVFGDNYRFLTRNYDWAENGMKCSHLGCARVHKLQ